jgi:NADP-dependent 3-hydroxy acid dehydrogenase YdfG
MLGPATRVLVVGASSGIGRETAVRFARAGAQVFGAARREDRLSGLKAQLAHEGFSVAVRVADASDPESMNALAEWAGRVDVLVYATGTNIPDRALSRLTPALWDMMIGVNLNGAYYATQAVLPGMRERKSGLIFYISSKSAVLPDESGAAYQAAKHGLRGLVSALGVEERRHGIRACLVCPGLTDTEIIEKRLVRPSAETLAKALRPEDVAELVLAVARLPARAWVPEVHLFPADLNG